MNQPWTVYLEHRVIAAKELDESRDDTTFDNTGDRRVLFLGEQFAELGGRI